MGIMEGISTLLDDYSTMGLFIGEVGYQLIRVEENIDVAYIQYPCFARPCPKTPRHGFVESRVVKTAKDLHKLWAEVKAQDVDGEIIVGPFIKDANYNAVYVSSGILSVGPGHDGATGGKKSISFPVAPHRFSSSFHDLVRIKKSDAMYLESVSNRKAGWHLTQVRGGPHLRGGKKDYVPESVKIKKVVLPSSDLLEWEQKVKGLDKGTVVYGLGHTLASHAAVHCILHKVPFVTSFKPEVGTILTPTTKGGSSGLNRIQFKRGVKAALDMNYKNPIKHLGFALAVLHNWAYLRKSDYAPELLGAAVTTFVKIGTALCLGEWRHGSGGPKGGREGIYKKVMNKGFTYIYRTPDAFKNFYQDNWTEGFGGLSWANCAWYAYEMWKQVISIYNAKRTNISDREVASLIDKMNRAITMAHNNGWWFNKITDESLMDLAADQPGLLAFCLADMFVSVKNSANKVKSVKKNLAKLPHLKPPFAKDHKGNVVWAFVEIDLDECQDECCYDEHSSETTVTIQSGGDDGDYTTRYVNLSKKELSLVKRAASKYASNRAYLKAVPRKGFKMPGGRLIKYKNVVPV